MRQPNRAPEFAAVAATRSVDENQTAGTDAGLPVAASDADRDTLTYSIQGTNTAGFTVDSNGQIKTGGSLNHEATDSYTITLRATDPSNAYDEIEVTISVGDVNEAPAFAVSAASRTVAEDAASGTDLGAAIEASDPDDGDTVFYALSGAGAGNFSVTSGGQIQVSGSAALDYEVEDEYSITLTARDSATPPLTGTVAVTITVTDADERPQLSPDPTGADHPLGADQEWTLANVAGIQSVTVSEVQNSDRGDLTLRTQQAGLDCNNQANQVSVPASGSFWTRFCGVGETTLRVSDDGNPANFRDYAINVVNLAPVFGSATAARPVPENSPAGTPVGAPVAASDPNPGDTLTYSLSGAAEFRIEPGTGQILVAAGAGLDYETTLEYTVTVTARDGGGLTGTVTVTIFVQDLDEFTPIPDAARAATGRYAYVTTLHLVVESGGGSHGYVANDYGGLTAGRLPGILFEDGRDRSMGEVSVNGSGRLKLGYGDLDPDLFRDAQGLQWLRVQLRAADNRVIAEGRLWEATACGSRSICVETGADLTVHDGEALGVDFFDAVSEALEAAPGGVENILLVSGLSAPAPPAWTRTTAAGSAALSPGTGSRTAGKAAREGDRPPRQCQPKAGASLHCRGDHRSVEIRAQRLPEVPSGPPEPGGGAAPRVGDAGRPGGDERQRPPVRGRQRRPSAVSCLSRRRAGPHGIPRPGDAPAGGGHHLAGHAEEDARWPGGRTAGPGALRSLHVRLDLPEAEEPAAGVGHPRRRCGQQHTFAHLRIRRPVLGRGHRVHRGPGRHRVVLRDEVPLMKLYSLGTLMTVIHLLVRGIGTLVVINLTSVTGQATYGGDAGFLPGEDSPYSAFGEFLYGDGQPAPDLIGDDAGGLGLARYGVTQGICFMSNSVKMLLIISTFSYPVIDIIPMEGFGLWIRICIHLASLAALGAVLFLLVQLLIQMGIFSNIYILVAIGLVSSAGLVSTVLAEATNISC